MRVYHDICRECAERMERLDSKSTISLICVVKQCTLSFVWLVMQESKDQSMDQQTIPSKEDTLSWENKY
jgi:hypothetical protein